MIKFLALAVLTGMINSMEYSWHEPDDFPNCISMLVKSVSYETQMLCFFFRAALRAFIQESLARILTIRQNQVI